MGQTSQSLPGFEEDHFAEEMGLIEHTQREVGSDKSVQQHKLQASGVGPSTSGHIATNELESETPPPLQPPQPPPPLSSRPPLLPSVSSRRRCELVLIRHGERVDETTEKHEWRRNCGGRTWDPPLTKNGARQARKAAERLIALGYGRQGDDGVAVVLSSPLLRTVQTASHIASALDIPVQTLPGLAECAAAVHKMGIESFGTRHWSRAGPPPRFLNPDQVQATTECAPKTAFVHAAPGEERFETFSTCITRLAAVSELLLIVTHREGIRELCAMAGQAACRTPYCAIAKFEFDQGRWTLLQSLD